MSFWLLHVLSFVDPSTLKIHLHVEMPLILLGKTVALITTVPGWPWRGEGFSCWTINVCPFTVELLWHVWVLSRTKLQELCCVTTQVHRKRNHKLYRMSTMQMFKIHPNKNRNSKLLLLPTDYFKVYVGFWLAHRVKMRENSAAKIQKSQTTLYVRRWSESQIESTKLYGI